MKYPALFVALFVWRIMAHACPISPAYQIAADPNKYVEKYNAVFFGRLCNIDNINDSTQIAEFQVIEIFKGNLKETVRIVNKIETECSREFRNIGTDYYVFGNLENKGEEIVLNGFPSFVPELYAKEMGMLNKLPTAKSYKANSIDKSKCLISAFGN